MSTAVDEKSPDESGLGVSRTMPGRIREAAVVYCDLVWPRQPGNLVAKTYFFGAEAAVGSEAAGTTTTLTFEAAWMASAEMPCSVRVGLDSLAA